MADREPRRQVKVRLSQPLWEQVVFEAAANQRSVSAEVTARVDRSFRHDAMVRLLANLTGGTNGSR